MRATVTRPFYLRWGGRTYKAGEAFDGPDAQVATLAERGLVEAAGGDSADDGASARQVATGDADGPETGATEPLTDYRALTVAQLRALCEERGVEAPRKATKAQLMALLGE